MVGCRAYKAGPFFSVRAGLIFFDSGPDRTRPTFIWSPTVRVLRVLEIWMNRLRLPLQVWLSFWTFLLDTQRNHDLPSFFLLDRPKRAANWPLSETASLGTKPKLYTDLPRYINGQPRDQWSAGYMDACKAMSRVATSLIS
jgi:hypothetical protein